MSAERLVSIERANFYNELERRRKRGWMFLAVCVAVASSLGIVLSTIITPIMLLLTGGLLKLALKLGVAPARAGIAAIHDFSVHSASALHISLNGDSSLWEMAASVFGTGGPALLRVAVPTLVVGAVVWWGLRDLFLRASAVDLIERWGARPARTDDLEERTLVNIVDEVAIGSGVPSPRLFIIDSPAINATAFGRTPEDAVLLVTRGLLDGLDRDETQAIIARLMIGLAVGDMYVAGGIMAAFHTYGFFLTLLSLPVRLAAWRALGRLASLIVTPRSRAEAVASVCALLEDNAEFDRMPNLDLNKSGLLAVLLFPWVLIFFVVLLYKLLMYIWSFFLLSPPLGVLWRNRDLWSDAQTVKLTRAPDAFARALQKVGGIGLPAGAEAYFWLHVGKPMFGTAKLTESQRLTLNAMDGYLHWSRAAANPGKAVLAGIGLAIVFGLYFFLTASIMAGVLGLGLPLVAVLI